MPYAKLIPFEEVVPGWPAHLFTAPAPGTLAIVGYEVVEQDAVVRATLDIAVASDLSVSMSGLDGFELILPGDPSNPLRARATLSGVFEASIDGFDAILRIRSPLLIPVMITPQGWRSVLDAGGQPVPIELAMNIGSLVVDESLQPRFVLDQSVSLNHPFMVGATGIVVEATAVRPVLSANEAPPAGLPPGFRGLSIDAAVIHLPESFALEGIAPESIRLTGLAIGHGGISGSISGSWTPRWIDNRPSGPGTGTLLGIPFGLRSLGIVFAQNAITGAQLAGDLLMPFFDEPVAVVIHLGFDGSFLVAISTPPGAATGVVRLHKAGIGTLDLTALAIEHDAEGTALVVSGRLALEVGAPALQWPSIDVQDLRIGPGGTVRIPGGWIDLQQPLALDLYGFGLEITRVGFGTEGNTRWIGVDGALRLTELLPAGASARGLRVTWDPKAKPVVPVLSLDGVGVSFGVPDVLAFEGEVALTADPETAAKQFTGGLGLGLDALDIGIDAGITVGRLPGDTFVFVTLGVGVPIPIAATGAALYGLQGLFAMNMSPVVTSGGWPAGSAPTVGKGDWYGWYKHVPDAFTVDDVDKWSPDPGGWAFGAGLTIGTLPDAGFSVNTKALLVVLLPGPVILLEGTADIFKPPPALGGSSEGTLSMLAAIDGRAGTLQFGIDAAWSLARVMEIGASTEAFFDFDRPDAWHLWIGRNTPESLRIRADYLALFHADAWLMLDARGVDTGLSVGFGDSWRYGPVRLTLEGWIGGQARMSTRPAQLAGRLSLGGEASVQAGPFGMGILVEAGLSGKSFAPYEVKGTLSVAVDLPKPLKDLDVDISLEWSQPATPVVEDPWIGAVLEHERCTESWTPIHSPAGTPDADAGAPVVPLDARVLLTFAKPMGDGTSVADNPPSSTPALPLGDHQAEYGLVSLRMYRKRRSYPGEDWQDVSGTVFGAWTPDGDAAGSRLQLFARNPFAFTRFTSRRWTDAFLERDPRWPCEPRPEPVESCVDWLDAALDTRMPGLWTQEGVTFASQAELRVLQASTVPRVLALGTVPNDLTPLRTLWMALPEPASAVRLRVVKGQFPPLVLAAWSGDRLVGSDTQAGMGEFAMRVAADGIDAVTLTWMDVETGLVSVCWTTQASTDAVEGWSTLHERLETAAERWSSHEAILEPECHYRLEATTRAVLKKRGAEVQRVEDTHAVQFQTGGPPGIVPSWVPRARADLFPHGGVLRRLAPYVRDTIPAAGATPVFRAYDLGCEFGATHVQQMYGADMRIRLRDDNGQPVADAAGRELVFANAWEEAPTSTLSHGDAAWLSRLHACTGAVSWTALPGDTSVRTAVPGLLADDFSGDVATAWTAFVLDREERRAAAWTIDGGVLRQTVDIAGGDRTPGSPDSPGTVYVATDVEAADVAVETVASASTGAFGIVFRWRGPWDYWRFSLDRQRCRLVRVSGDRASELWSQVCAYEPGTPALLAVQAWGGRVRCQIGERLLCDLRVPLLEGTGAGAVGLYCWNSTTVAFEEVRARPWPGAALALRRAYNAELEASRPLFTSSFDNLGGFELRQLGAEAAASTGSAFGGVAVVARDPARGLAVAALAGDAAAGAYSIECSVRPAGTGTCGLVARHTSAHSYLALELTTGVGRRLVSYRAAGALTSVRTLWGDDGAVEIGHDYALAVRCTGSAVTVAIDGEEFTAVDATHTAGRFGLMSRIAGPYGCQFRDLVVRSWPRTPVHGWRFTSSRYLGLPDLADSFTGDVWDVASAVPDRAAFEASAAEAVATRAATDAGVAGARAALAAAVDSAALLEVPSLAGVALGAVGARHAASAALYETLASRLGLQWRPSPPVAELSRVRAGGTTVAILLDLAEPLPWERISWSLAQGSGDVPQSDATLVWSDDGSRAMFVRQDGRGFAPGAWTLHLALRLDVGVERPVWRRGGSSAPEVAALSFALS